MLTTILGQVTRFFDRRGIVSVFSPSLVFWTLVLAVVLGTERGWHGSLDAWDRVGGTAQVVLITAFVAWVVFWTFLTLAFRASLVRLYEGYAADVPVVRPLERLRRRSVPRWEELDRRERDLATEELRLEEAGTASDPDSVAALEDVSRRRLRLVKELSTSFPRSSADVMPTRLGNILKAAELYSWDRYRLDSVVIWPRLAAAGGVPDPLLDAETPLYLMITVSAFSVLFGLPLAVWLAVETSTQSAWWIALALAALALALRFVGAVALALLAVIVALVAQYGNGGSTLERIDTFLVVTTASLILAALTYESAVHAATAYGEEIKATVDVHRRTLLEALHLQLPSDLHQERRLWLELAQFLYHGALPNGTAYRFDNAASLDEEAGWPARDRH